MKTTTNGNTFTTLGCKRGDLRDVQFSEEGRYVRIFAYVPEGSNWVIQVKDASEPDNEHGSLPSSTMAEPNLVQCKLLNTIKRTYTLEFRAKCMKGSE